MKRIEDDVDRDFYMSSEEAREYGIIDEVVEPLKVDKVDFATVGA